MTFIITGFKVQIKVPDKNGDPVEGATVEIVGDGVAVTDENGIATLENVPEGEQTVIIKYEGQVLAEKINVEDREDQQTFDAQFAGLSVSKSPIEGISDTKFISLMVFIIAVGAAVGIFRYKGKIFKKKVTSKH